MPLSFLASPRARFLGFSLNYSRKTAFMTSVIFCRKGRGLSSQCQCPCLPVFPVLQVAVKEFVFAQAAISGGCLQRNELIEEIVGEAAIMSVLQHPRILHLYGCSLTSQASKLNSL